MDYANLQQVTSSFEEKVNQNGGNGAWTFRAKTCRRSETASLLATLDQTVGSMPDSEKDKLARRFGSIIPAGAQQFKREYDDQFLEVLVEVLGWGWLRDKYPSHKVQFREPPDLIVEDSNGGLVAAMACKKIRTSDEDRAYFEEHQGEVKAINTLIASTETKGNPFLRKVEDTLGKAEDQLSRVNAPEKFIFIDFSFDVSAIVQKQNVLSLIKTLAAELQARSMKLIAFEQFQVDSPLVDL